MATPIMAGMVGNIITLEQDEDVTSTNVIKSIVDDSNHSFAVFDCQSANCRAFSIPCGELADLDVNRSVEVAVAEPDGTLESTLCRGNVRLGIFDEPSDCVTAALEENKCFVGDGSVDIMWADGYSDTKARYGCSL